MVTVTGMPISKGWSFVTAKAPRLVLMMVYVLVVNVLGCRSILVISPTSCVLLGMGTYPLFQMLAVVLQPRATSARASIIRVANAKPTAIMTIESIMLAIVVKFMFFIWL